MTTPEALRAADDKAAYAAALEYSNDASPEFFVHAPWDLVMRGGFAGGARWGIAHERVRAEKLVSDIESIITDSGIEDIYNWGAPLREIRSKIAAYRAEGK